MGWQGVKSLRREESKTGGKLTRGKLCVWMEGGSNWGKGLLEEELEFTQNIEKVEKTCIKNIVKSNCLRNVIRSNCMKQEIN